MSTTICGVIQHRLKLPPDQKFPDEMNVAIKSKNPFLLGTWSWNEKILRACLKNRELKKTCSQPQKTLDFIGAG